MKRIQSKLRKITYEVCKISLSCFDDKRYILDNGINTMAYFHKDRRKKSIKLGKDDKINKINIVSRINRINKLSKIKSAKIWFMDIFFYQLYLFISVV